VPGESSIDMARRAAAACEVLCERPVDRRAIVEIGDDGTRVWNDKKPCDFFSAPRETRTPTPLTQDKALNLADGVTMVCEPLQHRPSIRSGGRLGRI
jgi:hypothetical protein